MDSPIIFDGKNISFPLVNAESKPVSALEDLDEPDLSGDSEIAVLENEDDSEDVYVLDVNSNQPFELQKLSAGSVFLNTIEQNQFLPWSWDALNMHEVHVISDEIKKLLNDNSRENQLSGAFAWIVLKIGRSLKRILHLPISNLLQSEWVLNFDAKKLQRLPPRRKGSWSPTESALTWIKPACQLNQIQIPEEIQTILTEYLVENSHPDYLYKLWPTNAISGPLEYINQLFKKVLPRYSHGKLNQVLPNQLFLKSFDYRFVRTAVSHASTGLPPACAYSSFTSLLPIANEVAEFDANITHLSNPNKEVVLFGALLNPIEEILVEKIHQAGIHVENVRQGQDLIKFHNQLTSYLYLMLLAASGARPINDLFESISQFDFSEHFVFLDDKSTTYGNKGRLVPLPQKLTRYIDIEYRAHLRLLAQNLTETNLALSQEVEKIASGLSSSTLPFLFLLSTEDLSGWKSLTNSEFKAQKLFETPLPLNLFRHRLANYLANNLVDPEIIDGVLGHVEYGSESYGDFSERVWINDVSQIRIHIDHAFDALNFSFISHQPTLILKNRIPNVLRQEDVLFGSRARAINRSVRIKNTIRVVRSEINELLNGRSFDQLDEVEIRKLGEKMAVTSSGIPRHDALVRYHYFERAIEKFWKKTGIKLTIKKRYIAPVVNSPFDRLAPNAIVKLNILRKILYRILHKLDVKKLDINECAFYSVLIILFENKITDEKKLTEIASGKHFRVIQLKRKYFLEYSPVGEIDSPTQPVQRFKISALLVALLIRLKQSNKKKQINLNHDLPVSLNAFTQEFKSLQCLQGLVNQESIFSGLIKLTNQANAMTMPGIVASYLSGKMESWSLTLFDFIKLHTGRYVDINQENNPDNQLVSAINANSIIIRTSSSLRTQDAREFLDLIRKLLNAYDDSPNMVASRRDFVLLMEKELLKYEERVSVSLQLLAEWVKFLMEGHKRNKKDAYATSSVLRYFNALSNKFESLLFDRNLLTLEEDEVTEIYLQLLLSTNESARYYFGLRLYDFHRWAVDQYALEDPDWGELPVPVKAINVRPGIILEKEYQQALTVLSKSTGLDRIYSRSLACFLFFVYRFGLRSSEAFGLLRRDVCIFDDQIVLSIESNKFRTLKNKQSRRQVPLVFDISPTESKILEEHLGYQEASFGNDSDTPLFFNQQQYLNKSERMRFKAHLIQLIKQVTGNSITNIHHARHSVANRISYHLHGLALNPWGNSNFITKSNAKDILLGTGSMTTRRSNWASARYLGHATRATQYKSYIHYVDEWVNQYHEPFSIKIEILNTEHLVSLNDLPDQAKFTTQLFDQLVFRDVEPNTNLLLKAIRLIANGKPIDATASILCVKTETLENLINFLKYISTQLRALNANLNDGLSILTKISKSGLQRIDDLTLMQDGLHPQVHQTCEIESIDISMREIKTMIGTNGQILMYHEKHFRLMRAVLDYFCVPNHLFNVIQSNKSENCFNTLAEQYGFKLINQSDLSKANTYQLDPPWDPENNYHVEARCALAFEKNSESYVRNRYELLILFALFVSFKKLDYSTNYLH